MQRFRLLGYYVVGIVAVVCLTVWRVSMRRTTADAGTPQASAGRHATANTGLPPSDASALQASPTNAVSGAAIVAKVSIDNFVFDPKELIVAAGTTVTWVNAEDFPHTATSTGSPPLFNSKALDKDDTFSFQFKTSGTYDYFCKLHPYMTGRVIVK
jgi:plastocyanin